MKRFTSNLFISGIVFASISCGSADAPSSNATTNRANNTALQTYTDNNSLPNAGEPMNSNVETAAMKQAKRLEEIRAAANAQTQKQVPVNTRPAPEDSVVSTVLTDVARETRVWKKHPTLAKIEKVHDGQNVSIKVFLRDGRVIDLPGTAIVQLDQIPSATVLTLVGVGPTAQKPGAQSATQNPGKKPK